MADGEPAALDRALDRAAEILAAAKAPAILGAGATIEAQRGVVAIADRIGASLGDGGSKLAAFQRIGTISATFGEIRDRADLIVLDSISWLKILPRFRERFIDPPGRFIPEGRAGRIIIVFRHPNEGSLFHENLGVVPDLIVDVEMLSTTYTSLRAILVGAKLDPEAVASSTGASLTSLTDLVDRLRGAKYGVLIHGIDSGEEAAAALVRDLNRFTRFVAFVPTPGNPTEGAAESVLTWQAGVTGDVDFALGHPRHLPGEGTAGRINGGEADAVLFVGDIDRLDGPWIDDLVLELPRVIVGPLGLQTADVDKAGWTPSSERRSLLATSDVVIPTARAGIGEGGTVARIDGVMLPLRPPFPGQLPTQAEVLSAIDARLATMKTRQDPAR